MKIINCIGCGRLGKTLLKLIHNSHLATIGSIVNSSLESSHAAIQFIGAGSACRTIRDLPPADLYLITTPDAAIQTQCDELVAAKTLNPNATVMHCSGALSSEVLMNAKTAQCPVASLHPALSFADPAIGVTNFRGTVCVLEGDAAALPMISELFSALGGKVMTINRAAKPLYHAACVMANNYLVTLHYHSVQCCQMAGLDKTTANEVVSALMTVAITNIKNLEHQHALTGPLQRGDQQIIQSHLAALNNNLPAQEIYAALGRATLPLTAHTEEVKKIFENILNPAQEIASD